MGLGLESKIKRKANGLTVDLNTFLLAKLVDLMSLNIWLKTKDGQKNRNKPKLIANSFLISNLENETKSFNSIEEFEKYRESFKKGG